MSILLMEPGARAELESRIASMTCDSDDYRVFEAASRQPVKVKNNKAKIKIVGVLTATPDRFLRYFDVPNTAYSEIEEEIEEAKKKGAEEIEFLVDSGGGYIDGMYNCMSAILNCGIKTTAKVESMAASAAYMLASQCDSIVAASPISAIGSVGVAVRLSSSDNFIDVTNTDSKDKRPNVKTEEGKKVVEDELDDFYEVIAEKMAEGRKTTIENINKKYGNGRVMTARKALVAGMIDDIEEDKKQPSTEAKKERGIKMNKEQLKAEHPELYASIVKEAKEAGKKEGIDQAQKRVKAHLELAEASGDMKRATEDILAFNAIDESVIAHHAAERIKLKMVTAREQEAPRATGTGTEGAAPQAQEDNFKTAQKLEKDFEVEGVQVIF